MKMCWLAYHVMPGRQNDLQWKPVNMRTNYTDCCVSVTSTVHDHQPAKSADFDFVVS